ncbi:MAG: hypothetical protein ACRDTD_12190, partial [Pseudonocardiaceae bacterium]
TSSNHPLASFVAGELVILLPGRGRLGEAVALTDQQIEHTREAGLGAWTQLSGHAQRLQILSRLGQHDQVLTTDLPALRDQMAQLLHQPADNDPTEPWSVREAIRDTGHNSALALGRWQQALDFIGALRRISGRPSGDRPDHHAAPGGRSATRWAGTPCHSQRSPCPAGAVTRRRGACRGPRKDRKCQLIGHA